MQIRPPVSVALNAAQVKPAAGASTAKSTSPEVQQKFNEVFAETMLATMLKQVRKSSHKPKLFSGGRGEEVFGPQLDQTLAEKMGKQMARQMPSHSLSQLASLGRK